MRIAIKLFDILRAGRFKMACRSCPAETVVQEVIADLGIVPESIGDVLLNGCHSHLGQYLYEGDTLTLLPEDGHHLECRVSSIPRPDNLSCHVFSSNPVEVDTPCSNNA